MYFLDTHFTSVLKALYILNMVPAEVISKLKKYYFTSLKLEIMNIFINIYNLLKCLKIVHVFNLTNSHTSAIKCNT